MANNFFKVDKGVTMAPQSSVASPQNGDVYYDSTRNTFVYRNNGQSVDLQSRSDVATGSSLTSTNFTASVVQSSLVKMTGSTVSNIHGLTASSDAKTIVLYNGSSAVVTIKNASGTEATAANRILTSSGGDVSLNAGEAIQLSYDSAQSRWVVVSSPSASSSGGSGKNYLTTYKNNPGNGNFETASTTGWSLGTTGTLTNGLPTGTPTFGSGASGNLSIAVVSSGQLAGNYSLSYVSSAATTAGNMLASDTFSIDLEDQAKVLNWKFYYKAQTNPTNGNFSGTSSNSFAVGVWDVTNSVWLATPGAFSMTQNSGVGIAIGSFQTGATTAQIRFVVYNANASAGAITMYFDDFSVGPQTAPIGPALTDWTAFTPTGSWSTNTSYTGYKRRSGDMAEILYIVNLTGTPNAVALTLNAPADMPVDSTWSSTLGAGLFPIGGFTDASANNYFQVYGFMSGSPFELRFSTVNATSASTTEPVTMTQQYSATLPVVPANGDKVVARISYKIAGASSNVSMSNDTDTRVVGFLAQGSGTTIVSSGLTTLSWTTTITDTHASFNGTTTYTVPVTGYYDLFVNAGINIPSGSFAATGSLNIRRNSVTIQNSSTAVSSNMGTGNSCQITARVDSYFLRAGDTIDSQCSTNNAIGNTSLNGAVFSIKRTSGPSVVAATESVAARYNTSAGQSIANATTAIVNYDSKDYDTHNAVTTGGSWKFTCPASGKYRVTASIRYTSAAFNPANNSPLIAVYKNGGSYNLMSTDLVKVSTTQFVTLWGSDTVNCLAGDTLDIRTSHGESTARSLQTSAGPNYIAIERVGN